MGILQECLASKQYAVPPIAIVMLSLSIIIFIIAHVARKKQKMVKKKHHLKDCISLEDIQIRSDAYQESLDIQFQNCKEMIRAAQKKGYIKTNLAWAEHFEEFSKVSNTLYRNLEYENNRQLSSAKFHRYTDLHFRAMILDHIAYEKYISAKKTRDEIKSVVAEVHRGNVKVSDLGRNELYKLRDASEKTTKLLFDRMVDLQQETRRLKYKIRDECGQRGQIWFAKIEKNKQRKLSSN